MKAIISSLLSILFINLSGAVYADDKACVKPFDKPSEGSSLAANQSATDDGVVVRQIAPRNTSSAVDFGGSSSDSSYSDDRGDSSP